jgi:hypothetical protein
MFSKPELIIRGLTGELDDMTAGRVPAAELDGLCTAVEDAIAPTAEELATARTKMLVSLTSCMEDHR